MVHVYMKMHMNATLIYDSQSMVPRESEDKSNHSVFLPSWMATMLDNITANIYHPHVSLSL